MGQYSRNITFGHFPLIGALLSAAFVASFFTSYDANALSIDPVLDTVTSITQALKGEDKSAKKSNSPSSISKGGSNTPQSSKVVSPTPSSSTGGSVAAPPDDEVIVTEPLQELPTIDTSEVVKPTLTSPTPIKATIASAEVLGAQSTTTSPLRVTEQGWEVFGVAWYWFAAVAASVWSGVIYLRNYYVGLSKYNLLPLLLRVGGSNMDA